MLWRREKPIAPTGGKEAILIELSHHLVPAKAQCRFMPQFCATVIKTSDIHVFCLLEIVTAQALGLAGDITYYSRNTHCQLQNYSGFDS
jgi:hypothetical protein